MEEEKQTSETMNNEDSQPTTKNIYESQYQKIDMKKYNILINQLLSGGFGKELYATQDDLQKQEDLIKELDHTKPDDKDKIKDILNKINSITDTFNKLYKEKLFI